MSNYVYILYYSTFGEADQIIRNYDNLEVAEDFMNSCIEEDVKFRMENGINYDVTDYDKSKGLFTIRRVVSGKFVGSVGSDPVFYFIKKVPIRSVP